MASSPYDALDGEGLNGSELFAEKDGNPVEHQAERDLLINVLKQALNTLNNEDKRTAGTHLLPGRVAAAA